MRYPAPCLRGRLLVPFIVVIASACSTAPGAREPLAGGDTSSNHGTGGTAQLTIEVRLRPLGPVELVGQEASLPVSNALISVRDLEDREVAQSQTDSGGFAHVQVVAGDYRVVLLSCPGARLPEPSPVSLQVGDSTTLEIDCDTERQ